MSIPYRTIIQAGFDLLKSRKNYKQITIISKLKFLGFFVSESSFSNILNNKQAGDDVLWDTVQGIQQLIELELGLSWQEGQFVEMNAPNWTPIVVTELAAKDPSFVVRPGFAFYEDGRFSIAQKVSFFSVAQKEVIEFGVTLQTFSSYFFNRNDQEFKNPVKRLLEKGVNFKCYLLDPASNEASLYFRDRSKERDEDIKDIEKIKDSIHKLGKVQDEFSKEGFPGVFEVLTYKHFPYNYFMAVDVAEPQGKMLVSHYIYGESRANCPVLEVSKRESLLLYKKYERSLRGLVRDAKEI